MSLLFGQVFAFLFGAMKYFASFAKTPRPLRLKKIYRKGRKVKDAKFAKKN